jgi:hypothetical protein
MGYGFIHVGRFYYRVPIPTGLLSDRGVVLLSACIILVCVLNTWTWITSCTIGVFAISSLSVISHTSRKRPFWLKKKCGLKYSTPNSHLVQSFLLSQSVLKYETLN